MGRLDYDLSPFQRAKQKFGVANTAEQILMVLERVEKLEAIIKTMIGDEPEKPLIVPEKPLTVEVKIPIDRICVKCQAPITDKRVKGKVCRKCK